MRTRVRLNARPHNWLLTVIACVAMASQFVLAIAPLAEGRDARMASHIEAGGTQTHYAHSEATCVSCQARSIHGTTTRPSASLYEGQTHQSLVVQPVGRPVSTDLHSPSNPRAPPTVI
jgi:hypothetical protein